MSLETSRNPLQTNTLVGGWPTPLKNMSSSVGMSIPNWMGKYKIYCSKPPTSTSTTMISTEAPVAKAEETGSTILHPVKQFGAQERLEILAQLQIHPQLSPCMIVTLKILACHGKQRCCFLSKIGISQAWYINCCCFYPEKKIHGMGQNLLFPYFEGITFQ